MVSRRAAGLFVSLALFASFAASAELTVADVFGDHMVLQRDQKLPVWGTAAPGETVSVTVANRTASAVTDESGKWRVALDPIEAGGPYKMVVAGAEKVTFSNVLVGEVWVCSGQSNMQWPLSASRNAEEEIEAADYPEIRLLEVERKVSEEPLEHFTGEWTACAPETAGPFSAIGYLFGRDLHQALDVPVGLIHSSWGGTPAESWTTRKTLESNPDFRPILNRWDDIVANYPQAQKDYEAKVAEWEKQVEKAKAEGQPEPPRPWPPQGPGSPWTPASLYNAMIHPLVPYAVRGAIWYQGESNADRAYQYRTLFPAMINDWRAAWGQDHYHFLFVQLANFMKREPDVNAPSTWAELREAQTMALELPDTGMAVTIDIGEAEDIHPKNKQDVGKRLCLVALNKIHGKDVVYSGPMYRKMAVKKGKAILTFNHVGGGLVAQGGELKGFAIAGADQQFVPAQAEIKGKRVFVWSDQVPEPAAVRYAWANNPEATLYNAAGLPASPFRTDDWPGVTAGKQ